MLKMPNTKATGSLVLLKLNRNNYKMLIIFPINNKNNIADVSIINEMVIYATIEVWLQCP